MTTFNYAFFKENYESLKSYFDNGSNHPEYFYSNFYDEFIQPDVDSLLDSEEKESWVAEWQESLGLEGEDAELEFHEIVDIYDVGEDITEWMIENNDEIKEKFKSQLFLHMSEEWSEEKINEVIEWIEK